MNLDNLEEIKKLDPKNVYGSTEMFLDQCRQIHEVISETIFRCNLQDIKNIVFSGMGGSAYGGHVATMLFKDELTIPTYLNSDYNLPHFVDCNSLIILTSYSGGTEETLTSFEDARVRNARIIGLTSGGELAKLLNENDCDAIIFDPKYNPSGQPRLGTGYIVLGTIEILRKLGALQIPPESINQVIKEVEIHHESFKNRAKKLAQKIYGKIPVIFAGGYFAGNAHILRNQLNETAKNFAAYHILPEANHHLMEGLKNPNGHKLITLFLESDLYPEIIKKRMVLTEDVVRENKIEVLTHNAQGTSKLSQVLGLLLFGSYLSFYLAILYGQDPSIIPWVDYFKAKLGR